MRTDKPEYLKLYESLRDEISRGAWPYGAKLPSRRQVALDRGLSAITVEHSYELLCQEGYAESRPRSGFFVVYRQSDGFAAPEPTAVLPRPDTGGGEAEAFPFSVLAKAMRRVLSDYGEALLFVSHDRYFISRFAERIWELKDGEITDFRGSIEQFRACKAREQKQEQMKKEVRRKETKKAK